MPVSTSLYTLPPDTSLLSSNSQMVRPSTHNLHKNQYQHSFKYQSYSNIGKMCEVGVSFGPSQSVIGQHAIRTFSDFKLQTVLCLMSP